MRTVPAPAPPSPVRRRRRRARRVAAFVPMVLALLLAAVTGAPGAQAAVPDMGSIGDWYPGSTQVVGRVMWPDWWSGNGNLREAATFSEGIGWSSVDPTRVPEAGETFYLRVLFDDHAPNALMSFNAAPKLTLPAGLVRADDRLPVRCAGALPPSTTYTEYVGVCGLAGTTTSFTIVNKAKGAPAPAPAFRMIAGTRWMWDVPVRATAPVNMTPATVEVWANEAAVYGSTTRIQAPTYAGDPASPIWQAYKAAPRVIRGGILANSMGGPDTAERPIPWINNTWLPAPDRSPGTKQTFSPPGGPSQTLTWSPAWGVHRISTGFAAMWSTYQRDLGPAKDDAHWDRSYSRFTQTFGGGSITSWEGGPPVLSIRCLSAAEMNC